MAPLTGHALMLSPSGTRRYVPDITLKTAVLILGVLSACVSLCVYALVLSVCACVYACLSARLCACAPSVCLLLFFARSVASRPLKGHTPDTHTRAPQAYFSSFFLSKNTQRHRFSPPHAYARSSPYLFSVCSLLVPYDVAYFRENFSPLCCNRSLHHDYLLLRFYSLFFYWLVSRSMQLFRFPVANSA